MTTPLPPVDPVLVDAFWQRAVASGAVSADAGPPVAAEAFGDSVELADELIALVLHGPKRATAGALADYEHAAEPLPAVGDRWVATDGARRPRAVLHTLEVRIGPLSSVDDAFAWDEGEGDRSRAMWLDDHTRFFQRSMASIGVPFHPDQPTVFERFEVEYQE